MKLLDRSRVSIETLSTAKKADADKAVVEQLLDRLENLVGFVLPHVLPLPETWKPSIVSPQTPLTLLELMRAMLLCVQTLQLLLVAMFPGLMIWRGSSRSLAPRVRRR